MGKTRFALIWLFIFLAAAYDGYFAWNYRAVFGLWEQNPFARWVESQFGLIVLFAFKFLGLAFAAGMAVYCRLSRRQLLEYPITAIIGSAYLLLATHYALGFQQENEQRVVLHRNGPQQAAR
jgi:hypothetical protein